MERYLKRELFYLLIQKDIRGSIGHIRNVAESIFAWSQDNHDILHVLRHVAQYLISYKLTNEDLTDRIGVINDTCFENIFPGVYLFTQMLSQARVKSTLNILRRNDLVAKFRCYCIQEIPLKKKRKTS